MSTRTDLATAATTVDAVSVTPYYRQTAQPGQGWVRLDRTDYPDIYGGIAIWQILIVLTGDEAQAEQWIETNLGGLVTALGEEMTVRSAAQRSFVTPDKTQIPVLVIEGTREAGE